MIPYDFSFILLLISTILVTALFILIIKTKNKSQIHYAFIFMIASIFIWSVGHILEILTTNAYGHTIMLYVYIYYFGLCTAPVAILFLGLIFTKTRIKLTWRYALLFVLPMLNYFVIITNSFHHLVFINYSIYNSDIVLGNYFIIHTAISYTYIIIGLFYLTSFTIKNSGFFSKQSIFIVIGVIVPLTINLLISFNVVILPIFYTPISFSISVIFFALAILKFQFLNISPIALQRIVDLISDSYIIVNKDYEVVDYNKAFIDTFYNESQIKRKDDFFKLLDSISFNSAYKDRIMQYNLIAIDSHTTEKYEEHIQTKFVDLFFSVEITPIYSTDLYLGTIILFKDITQAKRDLETIQQNHAILMEQERMASLGQLIGGIAHNLKTPIMTLSGGLDTLGALTDEYDKSIDDKQVTPSDHHEIAGELKDWIEKLRPYCSYMSDVISAVKDQAVNLSDSTTSSFILGDLLKRVDILMKHELKKYHCKLNIITTVDDLTEFKGEVNNLVQICDNLIVNAIQAYGDKPGEIDLKVEQKGTDILFSFKDYGMGISPEIKDKLFKEMLTTKGKNGTGLGLYMSYATIKGRFNGTMWLESELGKGTTFYISIPYFNLETK